MKRILIFLLLSGLIVSCNTSIKQVNPKKTAPSTKKAKIKEPEDPRAIVLKRPEIRLGDRISVADPSGDIKIVDLNTGKPLRVMKGHKESVVALAIHDGRIVSGSTDDTVKIWDFDSGHLLNTLVGHEDDIKSLFVEDDRVVSVAWENKGHVKIWDLKTGALIKTIGGDYVVFEKVAVGNRKVAVGDFDIRLFDLKTGNLDKRITRYESAEWWYRLYVMAIGEEKIVFIAPLEAERTRFVMYVLDLKTKKTLHIIKSRKYGEYFYKVKHLTIADGRIVTVSDGGILRIWDVDTGELLLTQNTDKKDLTSLMVRNGNIHTGHFHSNKIWDLETGKLLKSFESDGFPTVIGEDKKVVIKRPFQAIQKLTQEKVNRFLTPRKLEEFNIDIPPTVKKPVIPPAPKLVKGEFEKTSMFKERVEKTLAERQVLINQLQGKYRKDVEERNNLILKLKRAYENDMEAKKRLLPENIVEFTKESFLSVMKGLSVRNPKYDADKEAMYLDIYSLGADYTRNVEVKVPLAIAKEFKSNLIRVNPIVTYHIGESAIGPTKIEIEYKGKSYPAKFSSNKYEQKTVVVELTDEKIRFTENQKELRLQNPNLIDSYQVSTLTYTEGGIANIKDDLLPIIKRYKSKKIDEKKWLFIIAVEDYDEADKVIHAKNSASLFKMAAQKVFGVSNRNTYSLIQSKATAGAIKDKLAFLARNVRKGDTIFFYYSGHGVPDPKSGESYILPKDKVVDFIAREEDFKLSRIYKMLSDSKASKVIAFIDSCFSGKTDNRFLFKGVAPGLMRTKKVIFDKRKMVVMSAGKNNQFSNAFNQKGHRMFSYYLIKSLVTREKIDLDTLYKEVSLKVKDSSLQLGDVYLQEPQMEGNKDLTL